MKGGRRPPEPTPPTPWIDTLTLIDTDSPQDGYYVYVGLYTYLESSCRNPIFNIDSGRLRLVHPTGGTISIYDEEADEITSVAFSFGSGSSQLAANEIIVELGLNLTGDRIMTATVRKDDVAFKAYVSE